MSVQIRPTIRRRWVDCMGVHDASDELARLSLYGGQGTASKKQLVQRHLEQPPDETRHAIGRLNSMDAELWQELSFDVDSSFLSSTRLPHRALQAFANQQLACCSASNSRLRPVFRSGRCARVPALDRQHTSHYSTPQCCHRQALHIRTLQIWLNMMMHCILGCVP